MSGRKSLNNLVETAVNQAFDKIFEAKWTAEYINDLPDECFAYIDSGGKKDEGGKTVPRTMRHLPYKGKDGKVDLPHLRNALARLPQSNLSDETKKKAEAVLKKAAKEAKIGGYRKESLGEQKVVATSTGNDGYDMQGSYEALRTRIRDALVDAGQYGKYPSIVATFPKKVFIGSEDGRWFEVEYSLEGDDDAVKLGTQRELEKKTKFVIKEWLEKNRAPDLKEGQISDDAERRQHDRILAGLEGRPSPQVTPVDDKFLTEHQRWQRRLVGQMGP